MAKIYAALIRKGIKTLDEVPARLRSTVEALLAANGISAVSEPVSYTHLDVYKRQALRTRPSMRAWRCRCGMRKRC